ncbi:MAG: trypsin-like peptidase domain-containing protein [Candidatus Jacksonbacteria bacterium]
MTSKSQLKSLIASTIIASIILGGAAGGAVGALSGSFLAGKFIFQPAGENSQNITKKQPQNFAEDNDNIGTDTQTIKIVEQALPAVVSIIATQELQTLPRSSFFDDFFFGFPFNSPFEQPQQQEQPKTEKRQVSSGSGFIVSADGLVITNRHVVENSKADYSVVLSSGKTYPAEVIDRDTVQDLAVVKINPIKAEGEVKFSILALGESSDVKIGQTVLAIGNTLGEFRNTVTRGIVSGINRTIFAGGYGAQSELIEGAIQTDAAISSGNSGGPLLNLAGEVIGVNTAVSAQGENIGFALPVDQVKLILDSIEKHGKIVRPFLGVRYIMLNEDVAQKNNMKIKEGALIVRGETREDLAITPGSPADKAGLRENDVILEVSSEKISEGQSLQSILSKYQAGDTVKLKINRAGEEMEVEVKLADRGEF